MRSCLGRCCDYLLLEALVQVLEDHCGSVLELQGATRVLDLQLVVACEQSRCGDARTDLELVGLEEELLQGVDEFARRLLE